MSTNPLRVLARLGQSFWLDSLSREILISGELEKLISEDGLTGITSNPTIFHQAVLNSDLYDATISREAEGGVEDVYEAIAQEDIRAACDLLRPVYDATNGRDGFVSLEESPHIARDKEAGIREGVRLWNLIDRPNLLIKVPATSQGIEAAQELLIDGVNVNMTLIFSLDDYAAVAKGYLYALEERKRLGRSLAKIASVASMFVSRIDTKIDAWLDVLVKGESESDRRQSIRRVRGKAAIANARLCYEAYKEFFQSARFRRLADEGARPQRVLTASTSTKDPTYSDTYYVDALIGHDTVVTMAPSTVTAYRDHGSPRLTMEQDREKSPEDVRELQSLGIDLGQAMRELQEEGVDKFVDSYDSLLECISKRQLGLLSTGIELSRGA